MSCLTLSPGRRETRVLRPRLRAAGYGRYVTAVPAQIAGSGGIFILAGRVILCGRNSRLLNRKLRGHSEAVALLGVVKADDCPSVVSTGASNALDSVVAVFEDQLAVAI